MAFAALQIRSSGGELDSSVRIVRLQHRMFAALGRYICESGL